MINNRTKIVIKNKYDSVLHNTKIVNNYLETINKYKQFPISNYVDKQILLSYNETTNIYSKIILQYNNEIKTDMFLLNNDCLYYIFRFLDDIDIINCSIVSKQFYILSKNEMLWEPLFDNNFYNVPKTTGEYYDDYKIYYILDKFFLKYYEAGINHMYYMDTIEFDGTETIPISSILYILTEMNFLDNLGIFTIKNANLETMPIEICDMNNISGLNFICNNTKTIPKEIGKLTEVEFISLTFNELEEIPIEIGKLNNLIWLNLDDNKLKSLPKELGQLINLEILTVSNNNLKTIPTELGQLINLTELDLNHNKLKSIPKEFEQLVNLQHLDLSFNKLKTIPKELDKLNKLTDPNLDNNEIEYDDEIWNSSSKDE